MKVVYVSYVYKGDYHDPESWLKRIDFFTGVLERVALQAEVVAIYNIAYKGKLVRNGVTYLFPAFTSMRWPVAFNRYILSLQPDAVVIQGFSPVQIFLLGNSQSKLKIFVQHRAEKPFTGIKKILQRRADRFTRNYFFSAGELASEWVDRGQIENTGKIKEMIGMSSVFKPAVRTQQPSRTFLWVGDLNENKNPALAVRAFTTFSKKHPSAKLILIYSHTELESEIRSYASHSIEFVGAMEHSQMQLWYDRADFILSTSKYESAGMSVCEGMSCGCIPVVTDIPSFRMMTENGSIGVLYPSDVEHALVEALEKCMSIDIVQMRARVIDSFERRLSFEANARTMIETLTQ